MVTECFEQAQIFSFRFLAYRRFLVCTFHLSKGTIITLNSAISAIICVGTPLNSIVLLEQLTTRNWHYCAVFIKSVRFSRVCKQSIINIFLICHILWHLQDLTLRVPHWSKIENCSDLSENRVKLFVLPQGFQKCIV